MPYIIINGKIRSNKLGWFMLNDGDDLDLVKMVAWIYSRSVRGAEPEGAEQRATPVEMDAEMTRACGEGVRAHLG